MKYHGQFHIALALVLVALLGSAGWAGPASDLDGEQLHALRRAQLIDWVDSDLHFPAVEASILGRWVGAAAPVRAVLSAPLAEMEILSAERLGGGDNEQRVKVRLEILLVDEQYRDTVVQWLLDNGYNAALLGMTEEDFAVLAGEVARSLAGALPRKEVVHRVELVDEGDGWRLRRPTVPLELGASLQRLRREAEEALAEIFAVAGRKLPDEAPEPSTVDSAEPIWKATLPGDGLPERGVLQTGEGVLYRTSEQIGLIDPHNGEVLWSRDDEIRDPGLHAWSVEGDFAVYSHEGADGRLYLRRVSLTDGRTSWAEPAAGDRDVGILRSIGRSGALLLLHGTFSCPDVPGQYEYGTAAHLWGNGASSVTTTALHLLFDGMNLYEAVASSIDSPLAVRRHCLRSGQLLWETSYWDRSEEQMIMSFELVEDKLLLGTTGFCHDGSCDTVLAFSREGDRLFERDGYLEHVYGEMAAISVDDALQVVHVPSGELHSEILVSTPRSAYFIRDDLLVMICEDSVTGVHPEGQVQFTLDVERGSVRISDDVMYIHAGPHLVSVDVAEGEIQWGFTEQDGKMAIVVREHHADEVLFAKIRPHGIVTDGPPRLFMPRSPHFMDCAILSREDGADVGHHAAVEMRAGPRMDTGTRTYLLDPYGVTSVCASMGEKMWQTVLGSGGAVGRTPQALIDRERSISISPLLESETSVAVEYAPLKVADSAVGLEPYRVRVIDREDGEVLFQAEGRAEILLDDSVLMIGPSEDGEMQLHLLGVP